MTPNDKGRFGMAIGALAEAYRQTITAATVRAYELGLDDLPIEAIEGAVRRALRQCKFMPAPIELRELSGEVNGSNRAVLAWGAFEQAVIVHGGYKSVCFDDPLINATVRNLGGWQRCCEMPADEFDKWLRKDFLKAYEAIEAAGVGPEGGYPLVGIIEQENGIRGQFHDSQKVIMVETGLPGSSRQLPAPKAKPKQIESVSANIGRMP